MLGAGWLLLGGGEDDGPLPEDGAAGPVSVGAGALVLGALLEAPGTWRESRIVWAWVMKSCQICAG